ncbi:MAG: WbuC family cupin fold metalloprotein [Bacteroidales bacterium]|nr:WbuC family cupin fold metalloprotein [Bacteroidales bacterium]
MKFEKELLDSLTSRAKASPRLRMNLDLRNSPEDLSQRMLNALEPGTVIPVHRHTKSSEVLVMLRGSIRQNYYDGSGVLVKSFVASAGGCAEGSVPGFAVPAGQWHNTECLESGTVFLECKDGPYEPLGPDDVMNV